MARVDVLREVKEIQGQHQWQLCFHWARYRYDDGDINYGYRFVWRRGSDGSIQAARGQARITSISVANSLIEKASAEGWGNRDWDLMEQAARRLEKEGCVVNLANGYVGWPNKEAAAKNNLDQKGFDDAKIISDWAH